MPSTKLDIGLEIIEGPTSATEQSSDGSWWNHNAYKLRLSYDGRTMTVPWKAGFGITGPPTADDVMESLALDAAGFDNTRSFEDWADDYGYDTDSRKAERIYKAVQTQSDKLARFLGDDYSRALEQYDGS
jgi:hypothetical protein